MGWSSGSTIMDAVIEGVLAEVESPEARKRIYKPVLKMMENQDWDTQDECLGKDTAFDELLKEMYPDWFDT